MVVGEVTIDPRRVLYTAISRKAKDWQLTITYLIGNQATNLEQCGTKAAMMKLADDIDQLAYKGPLADAVSSLTVDGETEEEDEADETEDDKRDVWERKRVGFTPN